MLLSRNKVSFLLTLPAGVLLILNGIRGPTELYELGLQYLEIIGDAFIRSVVTAVLVSLMLISMTGGFAVFAGGLLIFKNHVLTGKLLIGLGAGVGFFWPLILFFTLIMSWDTSLVAAQYSILGWTGLFLAFAAVLIAK